MREVKAINRYGRASDDAKVFLFNNRWGISYIKDTLEQEAFCWNLARCDGGDAYRLVMWSTGIIIKRSLDGDASEIIRMWDLYGRLIDGWWDLECLIEEVDNLPPTERVPYLGDRIGKLPTRMNEDGLLTFIRPKSGDFAEGYLDKVSRQILRDYIVEPDQVKSDDLLEILCDRLEETMPE